MRRHFRFRIHNRRQRRHQHKEEGKMKSIVVVIVAMVMLTMAVLAGAEDRATKKEAEALVKKAVAHFKMDGVKAYADFTAPSRSFVNKDLYIAAYDVTGKCVAHGQNQKQAGKDLIGMKDPDGKLFVKERVELALSKGRFWQDYKFTDPLTKKVMQKQMYCELADSKIIICGGVYKQ
jgi:cytochrome c